MSRLEKVIELLSASIGEVPDDVKQNLIEIEQKHPKQFLLYCIEKMQAVIVLMLEEFDTASEALALSTMHMELVYHEPDSDCWRVNAELRQKREFLKEKIDKCVAAGETFVAMHNGTERN